jgi:hypothetical protein
MNGDTLDEQLTIWLTQADLDRLDALTVDHEKLGTNRYALARSALRIGLTSLEVDAAPNAKK